MTTSLSRRLIASVYARLGAQSRLAVADLVTRNFEEATYRRLAQMGFAPDGYIDVGAYHGNWTRLAHRLALRPDRSRQAPPAGFP